MKFSLTNQMRKIGLYGMFLSLILLFFGANQAFAAPIQIYFSDLHCISETPGLGGDDPYLIVTAVKLNPGGLPTSRVFRYGPFDDVDAGERHYGPGIAESFWDLNNAAGEPDLNRMIFIVALMENDDGDPDFLRTLVQGTVSATIIANFSNGNINRSALADQLIDDIGSTLGAPTGFPDFDQSIGPPQELRFTPDEITQASAGQTVQLRMNFSGDQGGNYDLNFGARRPQPPTGDLLWHKHNDWDDGDLDWGNGGTAAKVGVGWHSFESVFSSSDGVIYGIDPNNGDLMWYKHNEWRNGQAVWANSAGRRVGVGWRGFKFVFATSGGVIYAVTQTGDLLWYKHTGWQNGAFTWAPGSGTRIGFGFQSVVSAFASSSGIIYTIASNGDLLWYKHTGWQNGAATWANSGNGRKIGNGWLGYKSVFATAGGVIYGVQNDGILKWYRHYGWQNGDADWANAGTGINVGSNFQKFKTVFATYPTTSFNLFGDDTVIYGIHPSN
jgi:hypothetical protein